MIFYVYFDPAVIATAQADGPYALQLLIATLRGFLQNCLIVDFDDYRIQQFAPFNPPFRSLLR